MIVFYDERGRYQGHADEGYPAPSDALAHMAGHHEGRVTDFPPIDSAFWYFPDGVPTVRPALDHSVQSIVEDGDKITRIAGIPAGVIVFVQGPEPDASVETDGEPLDLVLRSPGEYRVTFDPFPARPVTLTISVSEAA